MRMRMGGGGGCCREHKECKKKSRQGCMAESMDAAERGLDKAG
jgi:hypothetical protein